MQQNCTYNAYFINGTANIMGVFYGFIIVSKNSSIYFYANTLHLLYTNGDNFSGAIFQHNNMYCIGECCDYNNIKA